MSDSLPPAPPPAYGGAAPAAKKAPVLSIVSLILGIISFLGGWIVIIPFIGSILHLFLPAGAIVTGFLGKKKEPQAAKGLWLTGIILGFIGLIIAVLFLILWSVGFAGLDWSQIDTTTY